MPDHGPGRYGVGHREREGDPVVPAGTVEIDAGLTIHILSAEPDFTDRLELAAETLNDADSFMVRTMPPEGTEGRRLVKRAVPRDSAEAGEALSDLLRKDHGFVLTPDA